MTTIGDFAFSNCYALEEIDVPDSVKEIGIWAFESCINLKRFTVPAGITELSMSMFNRDNQLEEVILPSVCIAFKPFSVIHAKSAHFLAETHTRLPNAANFSAITLPTRP